MCRVCVQIREVLADTMRRVVQKVTGGEMSARVLLNARTELTQHACYKAAVSHYKTACFNWHKMEVLSFTVNTLTQPQAR